MTVHLADPQSVTQYAVWGHDATEGKYRAQVARKSSAGRDDAGRAGWSWELGFTPADGVGFLCSGGTEADLIWSHGTALETLRALASLVSAWGEALRHGETSDNYDIFPICCEPFMGASEEFWMELNLDSE